MTNPRNVDVDKFPIVHSHTGLGPAPGEPATVLSNRLGSNAYPDTVTQEGAPGASGPVPNWHTVLRGLTVLNGATTFGSPGASKLNVLSSSSLSACDVMRIGKPLWILQIPAISQPSSNLPLKHSLLGTGKSQTKLKTKRWRASYFDRP